MVRLAGDDAGAFTVANCAWTLASKSLTLVVARPIAAGQAVALELTKAAGLTLPSALLPDQPTLTIAAAAAARGILVSSVGAFFGQIPHAFIACCLNTPRFGHGR